MRNDHAASSTAVSVLWPASQTISVGFILLALLGTAILALSAKVQVPFWPVPMTMQTLAVLVIGVAFGWRLGGATVALYLAEGACGLPVFAGTPEKGIGLAYMAGPTGGYLAGFLAAAVVAGWLAERGWDRTFARAVVINLLGNALVLAMGAAWLAGTVGIADAVRLGLQPFLLATVLKVGLGAAGMPLVWRYMKQLK